VRLYWQSAVTNVRPPASAEAGPAWVLETEEMVVTARLEPVGDASTASVH
jgi:hypothetical protein